MESDGFTLQKLWTYRCFNQESLRVGFESEGGSGTLALLSTPQHQVLFETK